LVSLLRTRAICSDLVNLRVFLRRRMRRDRDYGLVWRVGSVTSKRQPPLLRERSHVFLERLDVKDENRRVATCAGSSEPAELKLLAWKDEKCDWSPERGRMHQQLVKVGRCR